MRKLFQRLGCFFFFRWRTAALTQDRPRPASRPTSTFSDTDDQFRRRCTAQASCVSNNKTTTTTTQRRCQDAPLDFAAANNERHADQEHGRADGPNDATARTAHRQASHVFDLGEAAGRRHVLHPLRHLRDNLLLCATTTTETGCIVTRIHVHVHRRM